MALLLWYWSYCRLSHSVTCLWYGHKLGLFTFYWGRFTVPCWVKEGHFSREKTTGSLSNDEDGGSGNVAKKYICFLSFIFTSVAASVSHVLTATTKIFSHYFFSFFFVSLFLSVAQALSIHGSVEIEIKVEKKTRLLQLPIHLHMRGVYTLQATVIFHVHESPWTPAMPKCTAG